MSIVLPAMAGAGVIIGLFYFGGLWLTLNKLTGSSKWGLLLGASFLLRNIITVAAFYLLSAGDWQRILALAVGFTLVRFFAIKRIQPKPVVTP